MPVLIRPLADTDLENAGKILSLAFQRSGNWSADLRLYRKIQPDGYFLAEEDGVLVGMVGAVIYSTYAYVGMMAVHPECQRKGIGLALMQHLLAWLDGQQVPLTLLDASPSGQPLYEQLGFVAFKRVEIYQHSGGFPVFPCPQRVKPVGIADLDQIQGVDTIVFGADRGRVLHLLLETYPGRAFLLPGAAGQFAGYLFAPENRIGPWVMQEEADAEEMLIAALSLPFPGPVSLAVPEENRAAGELLLRYGFVPVRGNLHMGRGAGVPPGLREKIFAQASLSIG